MPERALFVQLLTLTSPSFPRHPLSQGNGRYYDQGQRPYRLESRMRENRTYGSEGGEAQTNALSLPLSTSMYATPLFLGFCCVSRLHAAQEMSLPLCRGNRHFRGCKPDTTVWPGGERRSDGRRWERTSTHVRTPFRAYQKIGATLSATTGVKSKPDALTAPDRSSLPSDRRYGV